MDAVSPFAITTEQRYRAAVYAVDFQLGRFSYALRWTAQTEGFEDFLRPLRTDLIRSGTV